MVSWARKHGYVHSHKKYEVKAFHPTAFERGVYAVSFHEKRKDWTDKHKKFTQVKSNSPRNAIKKAAKQFRI